MPSEIGSDFDKRRISRAKNSHEYQKTLDSSCISFSTSSGERQLKTSQNSVSQSKQVSRCCISVSRELTCQILKNHSTKIGRRCHYRRSKRFKWERILSKKPSRATFFNETTNKERSDTLLFIDKDIKYITTHLLHFQLRKNKYLKMLRH